MTNCKDKRVDWQAAGRVVAHATSRVTDSVYPGDVDRVAPSVAAVSRSLGVMGTSRAIDFGAGGAALGNLLKGGGATTAVIDASLLQVNSTLLRKIYSPEELLGFLGVPLEEMPKAGNVNWRKAATPAPITSLKDLVEGITLTDFDYDTVGVQAVDTAYGYHWRNLSSGTHYDGDVRGTSPSLSVPLKRTYTSRITLDSTAFGFLSSFHRVVPSRFDKAWTPTCLWVKLDNPDPPTELRSDPVELSEFANGSYKVVHTVGGIRMTSTSTPALWPDGKYTKQYGLARITPYSKPGVTSSPYFLDRGIFGQEKWKRMSSGPYSHTTPMLSESSFDIDGNIVKYHGATPNWLEVSAPTVAPCELGAHVYYGLDWYSDNGTSNYAYAGDRVETHTTDTGWEIEFITFSAPVDTKLVSGEGGYNWYIDYGSAENTAAQNAAYDVVEQKFRNHLGDQSFVLTNRKLYSAFVYDNGPLDYEISGYQRGAFTVQARLVNVKSIGTPVTLSVGSVLDEILANHPDVLAHWSELKGVTLDAVTGLVNDHRPAVG